jgi:hypothetical protein
LFLLIPHSLGLGESIRIEIPALPFSAFENKVPSPEKYSFLRIYRASLFDTFIKGHFEPVFPMPVY